MFFAAMQSVANYIFNLFTRALAIQTMVMGALYYIVTEITNAALSMIEFDSGDGMMTALNAIPTDVLYFLSVFRLDIGLPLIVGAMIARFLIRRLPVIG